ncbi:secretin N-terminal domain-containing protein [Roseateles sp. SL47]|uniref:secretin N-terminal domain-containing protein n=1 Tax=Roseateles sp. SL47 TaxID=2995138 RepID=UPI00226FC4CA|nr:secretin N-terminal domain-containing protein [Roseateles sp. SL47]WAC71855.1 secretin N-terminal domain-containing protein [Roseateles sp. SL47]
MIRPQHTATAAPRVPAIIPRALAGGPGRLALALGCVLASGCAVQSAHVAQRDYSSNKDRAGQFQAQAREAQRLPPMVQADTVPRFARHSIPLQRAATLPTHIGQVTLRYPGRHPLPTVAELISRLIDIPVIMTPDALSNAADYAPGGLVTADAPSTSGATSSPSHQAMAQQAEAAGALALAVHPRDLQNTLELDYSGPLSGLLNQVATRAGLQWEYNGGKIVFSRLVTRSILVKALPNGLKTNGSFDVFGGSNSSGAGGGAGSSGGSGSTSNGTLTIDFQTESDYWSGLRESLKGMLSARANLQVDARSGLVTVTDALNNVERVEAFLQEVNTSLLRQVVLEVEVLQVNLTDQFSNGINWEAVLGKVNGNSLTLTSPQGPGALSGNTPGSLSFLLAPSASRQSASKLVADSLQEYGKVSTAYSSVVTTTNRMPVPVGSLQTQSYVRQSTAAVVNGTTGASTGGSLVPGSISTGLGLMILPVILDSNRVLLQTAMQVSELREIKAFTSGSGATAQSIQLPNTVSFSSLQRISVPAGQTLVLVGYEREQAQLDDTDVIRGLLPISRRGGRTKQGTVILITPRLTDR